MVKTNAPTERQEQIAFLRWFNMAFPGVRILSIPNERKINRVSGYLLNLMGRSRGAPDTYIPKYKIWVEMKRSNWKEPKTLKLDTTAYHQRSWWDYLVNECGDTVFVTTGWEMARKQVYDKIMKIKAEEAKLKLTKD